MKIKVKEIIEPISKIKITVDLNFSELDSMRLAFYHYSENMQNELLNTKNTRITKHYLRERDMAIKIMLKMIKVIDRIRSKITNGKYVSLEALYNFNEENRWKLPKLGGDNKK
jgi:hypothetical protein